MSLQDLISHTVDQELLTENEGDHLQDITQAGRCIRYNARKISDEPFDSASEIAECDPAFNQWIHWQNLDYCPETLEVFEKHQIHALIAEDIINRHSRAKIEELEDSIFVATKIPLNAADGVSINMYHFCFVLTDKTLLTFSDAPPSMLTDIHRRLKSSKRRIRKQGVDYLFWAILDTLADYNTLFVSTLGDYLDGLEDQLVSGQESLTLPVIHAARKKITQFHRITQPSRDIASRITRSDSDLLSDSSMLFFRDLYDHTSQTVEATEYLREQASNLQELYYTTTSHHMNEVMKVLTSVSAIFLPLTFLAGIYGMNFEHMPELSHPWAYPIFIMIILSIGFGLCFFFKKKNWF